MNGFDLPRGEGTTNKAKRKAVIPDFRNDENLAVAQTHSRSSASTTGSSTACPRRAAGARFAQARELAIKHYQWMIRHDYLPRICAAGVLNDVFNNGRKAFEVGADPTDVPTMPIEFSVAAFRLGHAMIRRAYNWNARFDDGAGTLDWLFIFSAHGRRPRRRAAAAEQLDRGLPPAVRLRRGRPRRPRRCPRPSSTARCGSTRMLVNPLKNLPTGSFGGPRGAVRRPARQPRVPQPHARQDGASSRPGSRWRGSSRTTA